jgi:septum formation protein
MKKLTPRIVLASASPRRLHLLRAAGWEVEPAASGVAEREDEELAPDALALENARRKWEAVASVRPHALVLAADTVVWLDGRFFGKPTDHAHAERMLAALVGRTHLVVTGVVAGCVADQSVAFAETSHVSFHPLGIAAIRRYLASIDPLDKAGAYAAQDHDGQLIAHIEGSVTNVIGLPMERLAEVLPSV